MFSSGRSISQRQTIVISVTEASLGVTGVSITVIFILKINLLCTHEASNKQTQHFSGSDSLLAGTCSVLYVLMEDRVCVFVCVWLRIFRSEHLSA